MLDDNSPNPFAMLLDSPESAGDVGPSKPRRRVLDQNASRTDLGHHPLDRLGEPKARFTSAVRVLLGVVCLTAVLLAGVFWGKQFLLARLVAGLNELDAVGKQERLVQIASFGVDAVPALVHQIATADDALSESAFVLVQTAQNDWVTLKPGSKQAAHRALLEQIEQATALPDLTIRQKARLRSLVNQSALEFAGAQDEADRVLLMQSGEISAKLLDSVANQTTLPTRIVSHGSPSEQWTDWPPVRTESPRLLSAGSKEQVATPVKIAEPPVAKLEPERSVLVESNEEIESENTLQPIPTGVTVPLSQSPHQPSSSQVGQRPRPIRSSRMVIPVAAELAESPLMALTSETLIRHLGNPDAGIARQADTLLRQRGFDDDQIAFGRTLAVARGEDRIRLIDSLVRSTRLDSGPWLSMLLDDPDRLVRLHVVSTLAATTDPTVLAQLRERLGQERDVHVATRLRRILGLR